MRVFENANNFNVHGATFFEGGGGQNNYHHDQSLHVSGQNNNATYHNGPMHQGDRIDLGNNTGAIGVIATGRYHNIGQQSFQNSRLNATSAAPSHGNRSNANLAGGNQDYYGGAQHQGDYVNLANNAGAIGVVVAGQNHNLSAQVPQSNETRLMQSACGDTHVPQAHSPCPRQPEANFAPNIVVTPAIPDNQFTQQQAASLHTPQPPLQAPTWQFDDHTTAQNHAFLGATDPLSSLNAAGPTGSISGAILTPSSPPRQTTPAPASLSRASTPAPNSIPLAINETTAPEYEYPHGSPHAFVDTPGQMTAIGRCSSASVGLGANAIPMNYSAPQAPRPPHLDQSYNHLQARDHTMMCSLSRGPSMPNGVFNQSTGHIPQNFSPTSPQPNQPYQCASGFSPPPAPAYNICPTCQPQQVYNQNPSPPNQVYSQNPPPPQQAYNNQPAPTHHYPTRQPQASIQSAPLAASAVSAPVIPVTESTHQGNPSHTSAASHSLHMVPSPSLGPSSSLLGDSHAAAQNNVPVGATTPMLRPNAESSTASSSGTTQPYNHLQASVNAMTSPLDQGPAMHNGMFNHSTGYNPRCAPAGPQPYQSHQFAPGLSPAAQPVYSTCPTSQPQQTYNQNSFPPLQQVHNQNSPPQHVYNQNTPPPQQVYNHQPAHTHHYPTHQPQTSVQAAPPTVGAVSAPLIQISQTTHQRNPSHSSVASQPPHMVPLLPSEPSTQPFGNSYAMAQNNVFSGATAPMSSPSADSLTESSSVTSLAQSPRPISTQPVLPSPPPTITSATPIPTSAYLQVPLPTAIEASTSSASAPAAASGKGEQPASTNFLHWPRLRHRASAVSLSVDGDKKKKKTKFFSRIFGKSPKEIAVAVQA